MSTTTTKRSLGDAIRDAEAFRNLFPRETWHRWEFAGSVRRRAAAVGDVEHVVMPRFGEVATGDGLFAEAKTVNLLMERFDELARTYQVDRHVYGTNPKTNQPLYRWGEKYRGADFRRFNHEMFCCDPSGENWGPTLAIRTGPGTFSRMLVTKLQWNGYCNADGYVHDKASMHCGACGWSGRDVEAIWRTEADMTGPQPWPQWDGKVKVKKDPDGRDGGPFWAFCPKCRTAGQVAMRRVSVPDERQYFDLCGVAWLEPQDRKEIA